MHACKIHIIHTYIHTLYTRICIYIRAYIYIGYIHRSIRTNIHICIVCVYPIIRIAPIKFLLCQIATLRVPVLRPQYCAVYDQTWFAANCLVSAVYEDTEFESLISNANEY